MASGGSLNPPPVPKKYNPCDEFEESFMACLNSISKGEQLNHVDSGESRVDAEARVEELLTAARKMEAYFIKKRLQIATLRPDTLLRDETNELKLELARKEELLKKNVEKMAYWQNMLQDMQSLTTVRGKEGMILPTGVPGPPVQGPPTPGTRASTPGSVLGRPQTPAGGPPSVPSQGRMPGSPSLNFPSPGGIGMQGVSSGLQGPLAFLEKTTSGIGMGEGKH